MSHPDLAPAESSKASDILAVIRDKDVLLQHPYDSFSTSVQAFIEQAAADPNVLAIKQTLYRTSGDSPIIDALIDAAEAGKQVLAIVEIKARFDEQNNISWARKLEHAGVHVVYGIVGLKTHAKLCMVVRQENDGDAAALLPHRHRQLQRQDGAPLRGLRPAHLRPPGRRGPGPAVQPALRLRPAQQVQAAARRAPVRAQRAHRAHRGRDRARPRRAARGSCSSRSTPSSTRQIIDALYRASQAGVHVDIWVRGICALRPGAEGLSENIEVHSILGRFLEHSRVFLFGAGGEPEVYIGSADMMHRNLDRRVEALVRHREPRHVADLQSLLARGMSGEYSHWRLSSDGRWTRVHLDAEGEPLADLQATHDRDPRQAPPQGPSALSSPIPAAGTVPWRRRRGQLEVALVHRPKYDDWSWAKGKLDPGEQWPVAAVRETHEETALEVTLGPAPARRRVHRARRRRPAGHQGGPILGRRGAASRPGRCATRSTRCAGSTWWPPPTGSTTPATVTSCGPWCAPTRPAP